MQNFKYIPGRVQKSLYYIRFKNIKLRKRCKESEIRSRIVIVKGAMCQLDSLWSDRNISIKTKRKLVCLVFFIYFFMWGGDVDSKEGESN